MLDSETIKSLYSSYLLNNCNEKFLNKYNKFPIDRNNHKWWNWENKDFPRIISLLEFEEFSKDGFKVNKLLTINGKNDPETLYINSEIKVDIEYLSNPEIYDLHKMSLNEKDFDFILLNQTIEHLYDPYKCFKVLNNHLNKNGLLYANVPCINIPHDTPFHFYTGFTPMGLMALFADNGFQILQAGQWGNMEYIAKLLTSNTWPDYRVLNNPGKNEINCPVITWVLGKKYENYR